MSSRLGRHDLKLWPEWFGAVLTGKKNFEVRQDDRGFMPGDILLLREWSPNAGYSGRAVEARISYRLEDSPGLVPGYVVLGLAEVRSVGT